MITLENYLFSLTKTTKSLKEGLLEKCEDEYLLEEWISQVQWLIDAKEEYFDIQAIEQHKEEELNNLYSLFIETIKSKSEIKDWFRNIGGGAGHK